MWRKRQIASKDTKLMQDFIHIKKQALSRNTCDTLINLFEHNKNLHVEGHIGGVKDLHNEWKKDTEITISPDFLVKDSDWKVPLSDVMSSLSQETKFYKKEFTFHTDEHGVSGLEGLANWRIYPYFNFQRYLPGEGYYAWHCESSAPKPVFLSRMLAWMVYLNDVPDAGTEFKFQDLETDAEAGTIVIWPPYWTHMHRGVISNTHNKYILSGWFNFLNESKNHFQ
jgi:hypothetical protein